MNITKLEAEDLAMTVEVVMGEEGMGRDEYNTLTSMLKLLKSIATTGERDDPRCVIAERNL